MTRDDIKAQLLVDAQRMKAVGATSMYMFGSRAREDNSGDSDLDLFIDYGDGQNVPSFFDIIEMRLNLENRLGIPVHLGTRKSLDPAVRKEAERDAIRVF